jgi:acyl-CoA hydrolase
MPMQSKPVCDSHCQLVRWMGVLDANAGGDVHGGTIMRLCDEAAALAAMKHSHRRVVTAGMDRMAFLYPIRLGEFVTLSASVNAAWHTSMEVGVRVEAEIHGPATYATQTPRTSRWSPSTDDHRPAAVPALIATTATERRRLREAGMRRTNRLAERDEILSHRERESD